MGDTGAVVETDETSPQIAEEPEGVVLEITGKSIPIPKGSAVRPKKGDNFFVSVGDYCMVTGKTSGAGYLRFYGDVHWKDTKLCGVELVRPDGKNDGSRDGTKYFECPEGH